jgi:hypothetical protein
VSRAGVRRPVALGAGARGGRRSAVRRAGAPAERGAAGRRGAQRSAARRGAPAPSGARSAGLAGAQRTAARGADAQRSSFVRIWNITMFQSAGEPPGAGPDAAGSTPSAVTWNIQAVPIRSGSLSERPLVRRLEHRDVPAAEERGSRGRGALTTHAVGGGHEPGGGSTRPSPHTSGPQKKPRGGGAPTGTGVRLEGSRRHVSSVSASQRSISLNAVQRW